MAVKNEYVPLKEFANRMGIAVRTARAWAHSERLKGYIRRQNAPRSTIFVNWTMFQRDFERGRI